MYYFFHILPFNLDNFTLQGFMVSSMKVYQASTDVHCIDYRKLWCYKTDHMISTSALALLACVAFTPV